MKKKRIRDIYFNRADDRNLLSFTDKFLDSGLLWIYIAVSPEKAIKTSPPSTEILRFKKMVNHFIKLAYTK